MSSGRLRGATRCRHRGVTGNYRRLVCVHVELDNQTMEKLFQEHSETNEELEAVISVSHVAWISFNHAVRSIHIWQQNNL